MKSSPEMNEPGETGDQTASVLILLGSLLLSAVGVLLVVFSIRTAPNVLTWSGLALCAVSLGVKRTMVRKLKKQS